MVSRPPTRRAYVPVLAVLAALAAVAVAPSVAVGHGTAEARALRPSFNAGTVRLSGVGGYGTGRNHASIRVTVCLQKRYAGSFFTVKCKTASDSDRRVRARLSVPGCVRGVWRTTASGEALGRGGVWRHAASDVSERSRCS